MSELEQENDPSMDRAADSFAVLLSHAAGEVTDRCGGEYWNSFYIILAAGFISLTPQMT